MKRFIFLLTLILIFSRCNVFSQKRIAFGVNLNAVRTESYQEPFYELLQNSAAYSFSGGISMQHDVFRYWGYTVKINYINLTNKLIDSPHDGINDNASFDINSNINYIHIPIVINTIVLKNRKLFVSTGMYFSSLQKANIKGSIKGNYIDYFEPTIDENIKTDLYTYDYGLIFGLGSQLNLVKDLNLNLELSYNYGLKIINKNSEYIAGYDLKNHFLIFDLGLVYYLN